VGTQDIGLERARRQKWLAVLAVGGLSATALAVALTWWIDILHKRPPARVSPSPPADVHQQVSGYTVTRSSGERSVFTLHAGRTLAFQENKSTLLEDVMVEVFGRKGGRRDILRTHRCEYNTQTGDFSSLGPVEIELGAQSSDMPSGRLRGRHRVFLETSKVFYHQGNALAETDEPVKFRAGPASGTARGLVYATTDGWLELKRDVTIKLQQGTPQAPQAPILLTASELRYDKEEQTLSLAGPIEVTSGQRRGVGDSALILLDTSNHVTNAALEGNVKAYDVNGLRSVELDADLVKGDFDAGSGELRHLVAEQNVRGESKDPGSTSHLTADRLDLDLAGKPSQPSTGVAKGSVHLILESQPVLKVAEQKEAPTGPEKKDLTADEVRFSLRPGGASLKDAATPGPGTLTISSSDPKTGERVITAGQFQMSFDARSRIEALNGLSPTRVLFRPPAGSPAGSITQESTAERLDASFDPDTQTLREMRQSGDFQFHDGDRQGSSDEAHYDIASQTILMQGHPQVWDATSHVKCQRIALDMRTDTAAGETHVQAIHLPGPPAASASARGAPSTPAPASPTNVLADRMVAQRQSQTVHYEGHVRAWQGTDIVESSALDVYRTQRRLSSGSQVVSSFLQPASLLKDASRASSPSDNLRPVTVRADSLEYLDEGRRARYHGNVQLLTETTTLHSDRMDVYFTPGDSVEGSQVDHAEADGHVRVEQPGRFGSGDHGEYFAGLGKITLTGGPPILVSEEQGSTTGLRLTFFIHDDRLFVDGGEKSPSLTKHRVAH